MGLILFTGKVEKYIPPRKGRFHVLRVIREILFHEPEETGTDFQPPLQFLSRVIRQRSIVLLISDFLGQAEPRALPGTGPARDPLQALSLLRRAGRRHDLVAVLVSIPSSRTCPRSAGLVLKDAETGRVVEVDTGDRNRLRSFSERRRRSREQQDRMLRSGGHRQHPAVHRSALRPGAGPLLRAQGRPAQTLMDDDSQVLAVPPERRPAALSDIHDIRPCWRSRPTGPGSGGRCPC